MSGRDKGTALIMAMVMVLMIAGMATTLLNLSMVRSKSADLRMEYSKAFQIAQAAAERAQAAIRSLGATDDPATASFGNDFSEEAESTPETFAGGEYFATITHVSGDLYRIVAGGRRSGAAATEYMAAVEGIVEATPPAPITSVNPFEGAGFSKGAFTMSGGFTDSYDSGDGSYGTGPTGSGGSIGGNGDVTVTGGAVVNGNASAGGTVNVTSGSSVTGSINPGAEERILPSVKDIGPEIIDPADNDNASIGMDVGEDLGGNTDNSLPSGTYYLGSVEVKNNKTLTIHTPCTVYVSGGLEVKPNGEIIIDTSGGGSAKFFLSDGGTIKGGTSASPTSPLAPSDFQVYSHGTAGITLKTPHVTSSVSIYAPDAPITIQANAEICGSVVGSEVNVTSANTTIHYDSALADASVEVDPSSLDPEDSVPWTVSSRVWRQVSIIVPPSEETE